MPAAKDRRSSRVHCFASPRSWDVRGEKPGVSEGGGKGGSEGESESQRQSERGREGAVAADTSRDLAKAGHT